MSSPIIGLLPFYLVLYDRSNPELRALTEGLITRVADAFADRDISVISTPACCVESEFREAVTRFEAQEVDAIVTVHLTYSPSQESATVLTQTHLPLVILDTTPDFSFAPSSPPERMMFNHGIHGVMDLGNLLTRAGRKFTIHAGHVEGSDVIDRCVASVKGAQVVSALRKSRVGRAGTPFVGMGDFQVPDSELREALGIEVIDFAAGRIPVAAIREDDVLAEITKDQGRFGGIEQVDSSNLRLTTRTGLAIRQWCKQENLTALTINFTATTKDDPWLPSMPFIECCKLMERGIGYAGEGDTLTASWVGALASVFPDVTFTEPFCPDWQGDAVFLSHMGEYNLALAAGSSQFTDLRFDYTSARDTVVAAATLRPGEAVLAALAPLGEGRFRIVLARGEMLRVPEPENNTLSPLVNGWFRPTGGLPHFLEQFSLSGGIHHCALIYGGSEVHDSLRAVALFLGANLREIS